MLTGSAALPHNRQDRAFATSSESSRYTLDPPLNIHTRNQHAHTECTVPSKGLCQSLPSRDTRPLVTGRNRFLFDMHTTKPASATAQSPRDDSDGDSKNDAVHPIPPQQMAGTLCVDDTSTIYGQQFPR